MLPQYSVVPDYNAMKQQLDPIQQKQLPFALAMALTRTGKAVQQENIKEMQRVFDRPTRYTLNSLRLWPASKRELKATVEFRGDYGAKGHYLWPQIEGGPRVAKRFEIMLQNVLLLPRDMRAVPGEGAKLDAHGNMSAGQIVQILSQLRLQMTAGFESKIGGKTFDKKKVDRAVRRQGYRIFAVGGAERKGKLLPGVYARYDFAFGSAVKPLLVFVRQPQYRKRLDFFGVSEKAARRIFPGEFDKAMAQALATEIIDITR